jgi:hypothetical protein
MRLPPYLMLAVGQGHRQLSESLALHVEEIYANCRRADEKILGTSLAIYVNDLVSSQTASDRRATLIAMSDLLEKLEHRLAPWYIRYEKAVTAIVALCGLLPILLAALKALGLI